MPAALQTVHSIADAVHSSERQLYRRLKKLTGFSPNQFVQEIRLQTAREWLENQHHTTVKEVCYGVGFQDPVYFSRLFLQRFARLLRRVGPRSCRSAVQR